MNSEKITDVKPVIQYQGNGTTTIFPFPFMIFAESDILVYLGESLQNSGFMVETSTIAEGGNVIFDEAPAEGVGITLTRKCSFEAMSRFTDGGAYRPEVIGREFNHAIALSQQLKATIGQCMTLPDYIQNVDLSLPAPIPGRAILWNADGTALENSTWEINTLAQSMVDSAAAAAQSASGAARSETAAAASAKSAADAVSGFDVHAQEKQILFDKNVIEKTQAFNDNAAAKQQAVDASVELSRKYAQGSEEELPSGSAKVWAKRAEAFCNRTDVQPQSPYIDIIELESAVIPVQDKKCWYRRIIAANDTFTIDLSAIKNITRCFIIDLIIVNPDALPFDLSAILPLSEGETADENKKWLGKATPDLSEAGEHWVAIFTTDGGQTWRASYEGAFAL